VFVLAFQFVTSRLERRIGASSTNRHCEGGFDEDHVMVTVSLPVVVVRTAPFPLWALTFHR
jgi:hypothetical protein